MASGAEVISTKFFSTPSAITSPRIYVATDLDRTCRSPPDATIEDEDGRPLRFTREDLDAILERARAARRHLPRAGEQEHLRPSARAVPLYGRRPDDPNDIFLHEDRRELRGLEVFSAWLNHDEVRSINSHDSVVTQDGRQIVRHHLLDFGSTLGSDSVEAQSRRAGNEFVWESRPTLITMLTLGLYVRPWIKVDYPDMPAVGRFESNYYRAENWKPDYPNPAFRKARPEDRFWAARIVRPCLTRRWRQWCAPRNTAIPEDPYVTKTLIERRAKVLATWLNAHEPDRQCGIEPFRRAHLRERRRTRRRRQRSRSATTSSGRASMTPRVPIIRSATN